MTPLPRDNESPWVRLLVRDPDWAFASWHVAASDVLAAEDSLDRTGYRSSLVLRLYASRDHQVRPTFLEYEATSWTTAIPVVLAPAGIHQAVLGVTTEGGTFAPICRSQPVTAPPGLRRTEPQDAARLRATLLDFQIELETAEPVVGSSPPVELPEDDWQPPALALPEDVL